MKLLIAIQSEALNGLIVWLLLMPWIARFL